MQNSSFDKTENISLERHHKLPISYLQGFVGDSRSLKTFDIPFGRKGKRKANKQKPNQLTHIHTNLLSPTAMKETRRCPWRMVLWNLTVGLVAAGRI